MKPELISSIAALISAACALLTVYLYRSEGKGFVWTKDHQIGLLTNNEGNIHLQINIPLFNFGKGTIKFISLKAKKINLSNKAMDNFEIDMDEAYFPQGALVVIYQTAIHTDIKEIENGKLLLSGPTIPQDPVQFKEYQDKVNQKLNDVPENIVILKCTYKDGSWFGKRKVETVISLSIKGLQISYVSKARRKELNEYYAW